MLLRTIERHLQRTKTTPTQFGREAAGDPCFVFDLRRGREPRPRMIQRVEAYMVLALERQ